MGLYEQVDYDFSGLLHPQDLFGREYVTMGGVIDHHLTTTVQLSCKMSEKLVVMSNNRLFLVLGRNCAESTKFTFQRQSIPSCRSSPTRKARGSNPPGRTKSSTLWGAALFVLHGFYGAVKGGGFEQPVPRALRPAGQKRPSGAFLGRGLANSFGTPENLIAMYFLQ